VQQARVGIYRLASLKRTSTPGDIGSAAQWFRSVSVIWGLPIAAT
jgi:hypothetical protein